MRQRDPLACGMAGNLVLALTRPLAPLWRLFGADPVRMQLLLRVRFAISDRSSIGPADHIKGIGAHLALTTLMGFLLVLLVLMTREHPAEAMALGQGIVLFLMAFNLVFVLNDFLFDEAEGTVVLPCPIDDRTVLLARLVHAASYVALVAFALAAPATFLSAFAIGPLFGATFGLASILTTGLTVSLFLIACGVALRLVGPRRFKSAIGWGQLLLLLALYGFQFLSMDVMRWAEDKALFQEPGAWCLAVPPLWSEALWERVSGNPTPFSLPLVWAAFLAPPLLLAIALRLTQRGFLQAVNAREGGRARAPRRTLLDRVGDRLTRSGGERGGWHILAKAAPRDARYRLRVIPVLAMPVFALAGIFLRRDGSMDLEFLTAGFLYLDVLGLMVLNNVLYSERYRAAWVWRANPVAGPHATEVGMVRLIIVVMYLVPASALAAYLLATGGEPGLRAVLAGFPLGLFLGLALLQRAKTPYPFSERPRNTATSEQMGFAFVSMFVVALCGTAAVFAAYRYWLAIPVALLSLFGAAHAWRKMGASAQPMRRARRRRPVPVGWDGDDAGS